MKFSISRPETTELAVSLFARSLHPELFETCERYEHTGKRFRASLQITPSGHVVEFQTGEDFITQVLDSRQALLPRIKRLCLFSTDNARNLKYTLDSGHQVQVCFECEYLSPDVFRRVEQEYWKDARRSTLSHLVGGKDLREAPGLSFVQIDPSEAALGMHAFHLYPEEHAIVKIQSLFLLAASPADC